MLGELESRSLASSGAAVGMFAHGEREHEDRKFAKVQPSSVCTTAHAKPACDWKPFLSHHFALRILHCQICISPLRYGCSLVLLVFPGREGSSLSRSVSDKPY